MDKRDLIETINNLIETSRDGEEGFRTCAEGVKSPQLRICPEIIESTFERVKYGFTTGLSYHMLWW